MYKMLCEIFLLGEDNSLDKNQKENFQQRFNVFINSKECSLSFNSRCFSYVSYLSALCKKRNISFILFS